MRLRHSIATLAVLAASAALHAATFETLHDHCAIGISERGDRFNLEIGDRDCNGGRHCNSHYNSETFDRLTGISIADLTSDGAHLTATLAAEAGTMTCSGVVHDNTLEGDMTFVPDPKFVDRMAQLGFTGYTSEKLMAYAFVGVESQRVQSLQQAGVHGITVDQIIPLTIFKVDTDYIHSLMDLGYPLPTAEQLIGLRVQGVNADEVRQIRSLGYQPTLDEMIQIRIFKVTPDFIRRMQARGFKNLTIAKLVQIRIFNLAE